MVAANLVKHYIGNTDGLNLLELFTSATEGANYIRKNRAAVDLIFLDVEMPNLNGLDLLDSIKDLPPVVLVSSHEKYAASAFEYKVLYYLVKPLEYSKFLKAIERVYEHLEIKKEISLDYLFVKENGSISKVMLHDIQYFEALGDYVKVHIKDRVLVANSTMKNIEDKLKQNPLFVRLHRSYIVNLSFLQDFDSEAAVVSKTVIPIGNKYRTGMQNRLTII